MLHENESVIQKNAVWQRCIFFKKPADTIDQSVTDVSGKRKTKSCEFVLLTEGLTREWMICGVIKKQFMQSYRLGWTWLGKVYIHMATENPASQMKVVVNTLFYRTLLAHCVSSEESSFRIYKGKQME